MRHLTLGLRSQPSSASQLIAVQEAVALVYTESDTVQIFMPACLHYMLRVAHL